MDRNSARTIKVNEKIMDIICTSNGCFCYTENTVRKIRTPEEIDPLNLNNDVPFENTLYRKSGTRNYITARVVMQSKRFLDVVPAKVDKETVMSYLMEIETNLLLCNKIYKDINNEVLCKQNKKIFAHEGVIDEMSLIEELNIKVYQFLMSAKQVLQIIASIFNEFHEYEGKKIDGPHIHKIVEQMEKINSADIFVKNLKSNVEFYKLITDMRNAQEHANKIRYLDVENFMLHGDRKIYVPHIKYFNNGIQFSADIVPWMESVINGLLELVDVQMMYNIGQNTNVPQNFSLVFRSIPKNEIDEACPVAREAYFIRNEG